MGIQLTLICVLGSTMAAFGRCQNSPPLSSVTAQDYTRLRAEVESNLKLHVIDKWFTRAVDWSQNGFYEGFDEQWRSTGSSTQRSIVYQSRLTWTAAQA